MTRLYRMFTTLCSVQRFIPVCNLTCNCCVTLSHYSSVRNFLMLSFHSQISRVAPSLQFLQSKVVYVFLSPHLSDMPHIPSFTVHNHMGWVSMVDIVTCYGLDGSHIESRSSGRGCAVGGEIFCTLPDWPWGPPSLLYNGYWLYCSGLKQPELGIDQPPPSSAKVEERVEP